VGTLDGVLGFVVEMELSNIEFTRGMLQVIFGVGALEIHSWLSSSLGILRKFNGVIRNPFSLPIEEVTVLISTDIIGNFHLGEAILQQIDGRLLVLITLPIFSFG
jgi:hypothetical protein